MHAESRVDCGTSCEEEFNRLGLEFAKESIDFGTFPRGLSIKASAFVSNVDRSAHRTRLIIDASADHDLTMEKFLVLKLSRILL